MLLAALLFGACANGGSEPASARTARTSPVRQARADRTVIAAGTGQDAGAAQGGEAGLPERGRQSPPAPPRAGRATPSSDAPPPPPPLIDGPPDFVFTFEQLRSGELGGRILHGCRPLFGFSDHDRYLEAFPETRSYMVGTDINFGGIRFSPGEQVATMKAAFERYPREIPFISILYTRALGPGVGEGLDAQVADGGHDRSLTFLAEMITGFERPVFVRLAPEFNGAWSGYHRDTFAASFRHIVATFRRLGVTNAIYVWNYMPLDEPFPYLEWYPGDDVVDWWSAEVFDNHFRQPAANAELRRFLADAKARGKPVIIAESGPATFDINDPATWDLWFEPYFALINGNDEIKAFCYSNVDFNKTTTGLGWRDARLPGSALEARYKAELRKPQYVHQH
jgi:hypothetical protein